MDRCRRRRLRRRARARLCRLRNPVAKRPASINFGRRRHEFAFAAGKSMVAIVPGRRTSGCTFISCNADKAPAAVGKSGCRPTRGDRELLPRNDVGDRVPGLAVRPEGGQLHLTWNRNADAVRSATSGVLFIEDGEAPVVLVLGPKDLTEGSLVYTPHSSDVNFRLRLLSSPGADTEEVIRVVGATGAPLSVTAPKVENLMLRRSGP